MLYFERRQGEGLVIGDNVVVNIENILEDSVLLEVQADTVKSNPPVKSDAQRDEAARTRSEKNAA